MNLSVEELNRLHHNPKNRLITQNDLEKILNNGGITIGRVNNKNTIKKSFWKSIPLENWIKPFTHKSYSLKSLITTLDEQRLEHLQEIQEENINPEQILPFFPESNERLEYLGDAMIQAIVGYYLWKRFPNQDEGFLTKLRSRLVRTKGLATLARYLKLGDFILISQNMEVTFNSRYKDKILENTFEAFIGAFYQNFGYELTSTFVITLIENAIDLTELIQYDDNFKHRLMMHFQKNFSGKVPTYEEIDATGPSNERIFTMAVYDPTDITIIGQGIGKTKKEAQQKAADQALKFLKI